MKITVSHHIFASVKGYQTQFRSPNVSDSENAELESFSFGQTNDADYIASLIDHPAFIVRKLRSGRWAITRVFQGSDDEYGRATLLFHTTLISPKDWIGHLGCDVQPILNHPELWQNTKLTAISVKPDKSPLPQNIEEQVHSLLAKVTASASPVVVDESACSLQMIRWVHRLLLDEEKEDFSYGYRVLSDAMDASLLCLSKQALRTSTANGVRRQATISDRKNQFNYEPDMPYEGHAGTNKVAIMIVIAVCILGISGAIFAFQTYKNTQHKKDIAEVTGLAKTFLDENKEFAKDSDEQKKKIEKAKGIIKKINDVLLDNSASELELLLEELKKWEAETDKMAKSCDDVKNLKDQLKKEKLEEVSLYPNNRTIQKVQLIRDKFTNAINNLTDDVSTPAFFENIDKELRVEILKSKKKIDSWESGIGGFIVIDPNVFDNVENALELYDPNKYRTKNTNKVDFSDPNQFVNLAKGNIKSLKRSKESLRKLKNDNSLLNAKNSHIPKHKEKAEEIIKGFEEKRSRFGVSLDQFIDKWKDLEGKANTIKKAENALENALNGSKRAVFNDFYKALAHFDLEKEKKLSSIEKDWLKHFEPAVLIFYEKKIDWNSEDYYPSDKKKGIQILYNKVKGSSLNSKGIFKDLYRRHEELQKAEDN